MTEEFFAAEKVVWQLFERDHFRHLHLTIFRKQRANVLVRSFDPSESAQMTFCTMVPQFWVVPITGIMITWCYCPVEKTFFYETRHYDSDPLQRALDERRDKVRKWTAM